MPGIPLKSLLDRHSFRIIEGFFSNIMLDIAITTHSVYGNLLKDYVLEVPLVKFSMVRHCSASMIAG